jgi:alkylation response protein AidB-like acyl-CoA dehydrogenase
VSAEVLDRPQEADAEELAALRETVHEVSVAVGGTAAVHRLSDGYLAADPSGRPGAAYDERAWDVLARQVGLAGLGLPEEVGGLGGLAELVTVAEELGKTLLPVPFFSSTVLAGQILTRCGSAGEGVLARVAEGVVTVPVVLGPDGICDPVRLPIRARSTPDGWELDGTAPYVVDGAGAAVLVVAVATDDGPGLALVDVGSPGVTIRRTPTLDLSRPQASVQLQRTPATILVPGGAATAVLEPALDVAAVVLAAEQLGGAQACLDLTVAYIKDRRQFGRPIGSFQAIKHTCADLLSLVESMRSAVVRAVLVGTDSPGDLAEAASVAQAWCSDAYRTVTAETVQLHGGIGFTWEHDAHLYFRRARADAVLLGGADHHRQRVATLLGW